MDKAIQELLDLRAIEQLMVRYADRIEMKFEKTDKGMKVVETSDDPYVVKLIQAHAKVVSQFVANGFEEAHRNHAVPSR